MSEWVPTFKYPSGVWNGDDFKPNEGALSGGNSAIARAKSSISDTSKSLGFDSMAVGTDVKPDASEPTGASGNSGSVDGLADYFMRGIVIILGFIFVATGLTMFGRGTVTKAVASISG